MKVHLAGSRTGMEEVARSYGIPWLMGSFYYTKTAPTSGSGEGWKADYKDHSNCKGLIFDSGAFTYIKDGASESAQDVDWYEYAEAYGEFIRDHDIKRYIELDLDGPLSYDFALEIRELLTDIVGYPPIPVWHRTRGLRAFKESCKKYDRVALGGFPWDEIPPEEYHHLPAFINTAHKNNARIHALGWQPNATQMEQYSFDSTDSTNWIFDSFGSWMRFNGSELERIDHSKQPTKEMYNHNLKEWVKLARHMDGRNEKKFTPPW